MSPVESARDAVSALLWISIAVSQELEPHLGGGMCCRWSLCAPGLILGRLVSSLRPCRGSAYSGIYRRVGAACRGGAVLTWALVPREGVCAASQDMSYLVSRGWMTTLPALLASPGRPCCGWHRRPSSFFVVLESLIRGERCVLQASRPGLGSGTGLMLT